MILLCIIMECRLALMIGIMINMKHIVPNIINRGGGLMGVMYNFFFFIGGLEG